MQHVWDYTFFEMKVDPRSRKILLTPPPMIPLKNREQMCEVMFDPYGVRRGVCTDRGRSGSLRSGRVIDGTNPWRETQDESWWRVVLQTWGACYRIGLTSGVVLDSGDGATHIVPVHESVVFNHLAGRFEVAGRDVTRNLVGLLLQRGYTLNRTANSETVRQIKESLWITKQEWEE